MATYQIARLNEDENYLVCLGNYTGWGISEILSKIQCAGGGYYFLLNFTSRRVVTYQLTGETFKHVPQPNHVEHLIKGWKEVIFGV